MKFGVGDRVSFLNERLSGRVTRIIDDLICRVETDDGFEIDANEKELVLVSKTESSEIPTAVEIIKPLIDRVTKLNTSLFSVLENDAIHFASIPSEDMQVLTGGVNFYLFNRTDYHIQFAFAIKIKNKTFGLASSGIKPQSEYFLLNKKRSDMIDWQNFIMQLILFKEDEFNIAAPINKELPLLLPDLKAEFSQLKGVESYSKTIKLAMVGKEEEINLEELKKKFEKDSKEIKEELKEKIPSQKSPVQQDSSAILRNDAEIDLHIQHLVDDYKHLSNTEIMQIQLKKFRKEMDHAVKNHYHKIVFIHGVGNGVLRTEILRELRSYTGVRYIDAPFEKYGFGATEVILI